MTSLVSKTRHTELILRQIDSLPTLPSVATRLLTLTADDQADVNQIIELVSQDPALTAKVLSMCRTADKGLREQTQTVDRAVKLLGFNTLRNAVLSIKVFEVFDEMAADGEDRAIGEFDRANFWRHCLAVAVAAQLLAERHPHMLDLPANQAFVCGLLHDIGKLALHHVLPKAYTRVVELTELNQGDIAEFERRIIGLDHHTAGKRLAEQWQLPYQIQDGIWLHGSPYDLLPKLDHKRMIGLVGLADAIARQYHIGYSGNHLFNQEPATLAAKMGLDHDAVTSIVDQLHQQVQARAELLGLDDPPSSNLLLESIQRANLTLGYLNQSLQRRSRSAGQQGQILDAITSFHHQASSLESVSAVLDAVVASASSVLPSSFFAILHQPDRGQGDPSAWLLGQYTAEGRAGDKQWIDPPPHTPWLNRIDAGEPISLDLMGILPWLCDYLVNAEDVRKMRLLPLSDGSSTPAVLLHDQVSLPAWRTLQALTLTWGSAISAAVKHESARQLGEQLAQANRDLAQTQDRLLETESMARLGEMAAGAAHEMNNPLAVISGRAQLLSQSLEPASKPQAAAQTIVEQTQRLTDLITALHMYAKPPVAHPCSTPMGPLLNQTVERVRVALGKVGREATVYVRVAQNLPQVMVDPRMLSDAVAELLNNAIQSSPREAVTLAAKLDAERRHLVVQVTDDGLGMDSHTLTHALDPFFSAKTSGRRAGLGLSRAQQWVKAHGGHLEIRSRLDHGTTAVITLPITCANANRAG